jgi:hypothetical protein
VSAPRMSSRSCSRSSGADRATAPPDGTAGLGGAP